MEYAGSCCPFLWGVDYRAIFEDTKGNLWFGGCVNYEAGSGHSGGILKLENQLAPNQKWTHIKPTEETRLLLCLWYR